MIGQAFPRIKRFEKKRRQKKVGAGFRTTKVQARDPASAFSLSFSHSSQLFSPSAESPQIYPSKPFIFSNSNIKAKVTR
jgi:hypothetical protein